MARKRHENYHSETNVNIFLIYLFRNYNKDHPFLECVYGDIDFETEVKKERKKPISRLLAFGDFDARGFQATQTVCRLVVGTVSSQHYNSKNRERAKLRTW